MNQRPEQFERELPRGLQPLYTLTGDAWLLVEEARDAIREQARKQGITERLRFDVEGHFDWSALSNLGRSLSLFAEQRLIDLRIPNGKPGKEGAKVLKELAEQAADSQDILVVSLPRLDRATQSSAWFKALSAHGVTVTFWPIGLRDLPGWIIQRACRMGLNLAPDAAELIAERVEGNLLAARQELEKLSLAMDPGVTVTVEALLTAVSDQSRFETFDLGDALLAGEERRALQLVQRLRDEGIDATLVLWVVARELRLLAAIAGHDDEVLAKNRIPQSRRPIYQRASRRGGAVFWAALLARCADVDRAIKGLLAEDPWQALAWLLIDGCGGERRSSAPRRLGQSGVRARDRARDRA